MSKIKQKTLCDWSKDQIKDNFDELIEITEHSNFICIKCARSASHKKWLCKAKKIAD